MSIPNVKSLAVAIFLLLAGCGWQPQNASYQQFYAYYADRPKGEMCKTDYFLVVLVEARHLDYGDNASMLKTMAKHPTDDSKNGDVGHVWVYVEGWKDGQRINLEGGQSGDTGHQRPTYMWGIIEGALRGDPNPARYLWESFSDGFFQPGSGDHTPTYAAKIDLTQEQFDRIVNFMIDHDYTQYSLVGKQCCSFAAEVASLADWQIDHRIALCINEYVAVGGEKIPLRCSDKYAALTLSSPDVVEKSLVEAVKKGRAQYALKWYLKQKKCCLRCGIARGTRNICKFPSRLERYYFFSGFNH